MADIALRLAVANPLLRACVLVALGVICALGQSPLSIWPATLAALAVLFYLWPRQTAAGRNAVLHGWLFGLGYFGFSLRWIIDPFLVDAARDGWMAPFAIALMAAGAALFWGFAAWFSNRLLPGNSLAFALTLAAAEVARSLVLTGFPWALLGHVWIGTPLAELAAFGGPHLLTLLTVLLSLGLSMVMARQWAGVAIPVAVALMWPLLNPGPAPTADPGAPVVRLVQPNAPQDEKWDPARRMFYFDRMLGYTGATPAPALTVWPETAIPVLFDDAQPSFDLMSEAAQGAPVVVGINRNNDLVYHNSFVVLGRGGIVQSIYDKQHIVPFGEYIPGGEWLSRIGITGFAPSQGGGFTPGQGSGLVQIAGIGTARALICYEGIFAEEIAQPERPRLMILITNDAWFGKDAGPTQHLAQARLRAIEQGLPMVRVANTGISAMIDAKGRIMAQIPLDTAGYVDAALPPALPPTIYARFGDLPVIVVIFGMLLSLIAFGRRNSG